MKKAGNGGRRADLCNAVELAKRLADAGAALMIEEKEISTELLSENLFRILHDGAFAASLRQSILGFAHPDAADEILKDLQSLCQK